MTALVAISFLFSGCSKECSRDLTGSYTYKTSGTVTLMPSQLVGLDEATLAQYRAMGISVDPVVIGLYPEQGQLHVVEKDKDKVMVTFNDILGNADVAEGTVSGNEITFAGISTKAAQVTDGTEKIGAGIVKYSGKGTKYEDMLVIELVYEGLFTVSEVSMTLLSSDVHCVAQYNK